MKFVDRMSDGSKRQCTDHYFAWFAWSEDIPYTGRFKCVYCGKPYQKEQKCLKIKEFKVGDPVTFVGRGGFKLEGYIEKIEEFVEVSFRKDRHLEWFSLLFHTNGKRYSFDTGPSLFHGHNVTVKITGEEIPDRKRWVNLYISDETNRIFARKQHTSPSKAKESAGEDAIAVAVEVKI